MPLMVKMCSEACVPKVLSKPIFMSLHALMVKMCSEACVLKVLSTSQSSWPFMPLSLIRFGGHLPKGGYDVPNGNKQVWPTRPAAVL